jgi:hypothetical protein
MAPFTLYQILFSRQRIVQFQNISNTWELR